MNTFVLRYTSLRSGQFPDTSEQKVRHVVLKC